ncbi:hypothetical protein MUK42_24692 [Musa troglodytarum]|uniref:Uncharacterized protein n=1 Tax=Musa troglodytarum TaxID=320322 RepID=A0A9E7F319_9LILI|nr:hypothetical protein MUK42_24692 [Musa troglodytarum]
MEDKGRNRMGKGGRHPKLQPKGCGGGILLLALFPCVAAVVVRKTSIVTLKRLCEVDAFFPSPPS